MNDREQIEREVEYWKRVAAYLASCHAATMQHEALLRRTSKSSRERFRSICRAALSMLRGNDSPMPYGAVRQSGDDSVYSAAERCEDAIKEGA
jgi:hypothetical protein